MTKKGKERDEDESWNEWTEGGYLEPDSIFGYGYLDALRKVFVEEVK